MLPKNKPYNLFLDDIRMPQDCIKWMKEKDLYETEEWIIVRDYEEFCNTISDMWFVHDAAPMLISFDHDLGLEHTRYYFENGGHENPPNPDNANFVKKTGKDCARWLVNFCMKEKMPFPEYRVHSKNPIGAENIESLLNQFKKYLDEK